MNSRTLDLNLLRAFDVVMVERNVARAAERLARRSRPPAMPCGGKNCSSGSTGVTPTAYAEALWPVVRAALEGLRTAMEPTDFDPQRDAGTLTLAMADATASVPALVADRPVETDGSPSTEATPATANSKAAAVQALRVAAIDSGYGVVLAAEADADEGAAAADDARPVSLFESVALRSCEVGCGWSVTERMASSFESWYVGTGPLCSKRSHAVSASAAGSAITSARVRIRGLVQLRRLTVCDMSTPVSAEEAH